MAPEPIQVLICESTVMGCDLLSGALTRVQSTLRVAGCVTSVNELGDAVEKTRPDVVLLSMDSAQNSMAVLGVVTEIIARHPMTRVILLLDSNHRELIIEAFRSGVRGVSIRTEKAATLSKAIRSVHSGQIWANSEQLHYLLEAFKATAPLRIVNVKGQTLLSERQRQLVTLVIEALPTGRLLTASTSANTP